jgi:hypothetical protein
MAKKLMTKSGLTDWELTELIAMLFYYRNEIQAAKPASQENIEYLFKLNELHWKLKNLSDSATL